MGARFTEGAVARHVTVMISTSAVSLFAVFLVDILTLVYVAMLHAPVLLAAVGIAKVLVFSNTALVSGLIIAGTSVLSRHIGRHGNGAIAGRTFSLLLLVTVVSAVAAALQSVFSAPLMHVLGADQDTAQAARDFILLALPATVLQAAMQMAAQILRAAGHSSRALWVMLSGAATLAIADPLLIFVLDLQLRGAGLAYALSAIVSATLGVYWVRDKVGLRWAPDVRSIRAHWAETLRIGLPAVIASLATPVAIAYLMASVASFGVEALAAMTVVDRITQFAYCVFFAIPGALAPVLGQNVGAGLAGRSLAAVSFTRRLALGYGLLAWAMIACAQPALAAYYHLDGAGLALLRMFCQYGGLLWALISLDFVSQAVFVTLGRPWLLTLFAWLRVTVGAIPFIWAGAHWFGSGGAVLGMLVGNALIAMASTLAASLAARRFFQRPCGTATFQ